MRYAYAITGALLLSGTAATLVYQPAAAAQTAQNEPGTIQAAAPRPGAPMSFADMVAKLQPAVVNISTSQHITQQQPANPFAGTPFGDLFGQMQGQNGNGQPITREATSLGSGFIISPDGYIVTNNHVVAPGARGATVDSITVTLNDKKEYTAKLVGRDAASDLAVLKITAPVALPYVKWGDSNGARPGDWVIAIGQPFGLGSTVTAGIVSAVHRVTGAGAYDRFIQTDAAINQGNSGGPMFDMQGNVIGVNSQIFSQSGGNIGIGFAIPAEDAKPVVASLIQGTAIKRGYLGVGPQPLTDDLAGSFGLQKNHGEILRSIEPDGPGARAGLKVGDVVVRVGGKEVTPDQTLSYLVANVAPGTRVPIDVIRQGRPTTVAVTVGNRPASADAPQVNEDDDGLDNGDEGVEQGQASPSALGLSVQVLTPQIARNLGVDSTIQGVVVNNVDPSSDAGQKLRRGDVIISANGTPITSPQALAAVVAQTQAAKRDTVALLVQRGRNPSAVFVAVKLKK